MKIGFFVQHPYHWPAVRPLFDEACRQGHACVVVPGDVPLRKWLIFRRSRKEDFLAIFQSWGLPVAHEMPDDVDVVVTTDFLPDPAMFRGLPVALVNHGTGFKTVMYRILRKQREVPYHLLVEGPHRVREIQRRVGEGAFRVHPVGYIKLDPYPRMLPERKRLLDRWGLDPGKPTLLYAPTYKPSSIDLIGRDLLPATRAFNLLIKLHPYSWEGKYAPHRHHRLFEALVPRFPHARLVPPTEQDILPFLVMADAVITEASSVAFEFAAVGKPVIFVALPEDRLRHSDGEPLLASSPAALFRGAFPVVRRAEEIPDAFKRARLDETMRSRREALLREIFLPVDGQASRRALEVLASCCAVL